MAITGSGDKLASGRARKASYGPIEVSEETFRQAVTIRTKPVKKLFCECKDCPRKFYSVTEFSEHLATCGK
jgi:hypothetical protein